MLEVVWVNGRKVLNCSQANYSFGTLYEVFRRTFNEVKLNEVFFDKVLILGYGAGGTAQLLREEYGFKGKIDGVEVDEKIISLTKKHFPDGFRAADNLYHSDAADFMRNARDSTYDMLIFDVYVDLYIPDFFQSPRFIKRLHSVLKPGGMLIYNKVMAGRADKQNADDILEAIRHTFFDGGVSIYNFEENRMFVARK
jgi:spermidine synthase